MPKVTQAYRDARREHILDAARRCFVRNGFHATSMQDLFAEAGLSSGAVYGYFASKTEMIVAIAEGNLRDVVEMFEQAAARPGEHSVGEILGDVLEVIRRRHAEQDLGGLAVLAWSEALRDPTLGTDFRERLTAIRRDLTAVVAEQQRRGHLTAAAGADDIAGVVIATVPGYILQLALFGDDPGAHMADAVRALWP